MAKGGLSKSKIISGLQCPKRLWFDLNPPEGYEGPDEGLAFRFSEGHRVGKVARSLFPGGILIEHDEDLSLALAQTSELLATEDRRPLFEATLKHGGVLVRIDVLLPLKEAFRLIEVKASTDCKAHYILDCAIQTWVLREAGYPVKRVELAHLNRDFVYQGDENYQGLFQFRDLTPQVEALLWEVPCWVQWCEKAFSPEPPEEMPGPHCFDPYECPYQEFCFPQEETEYPLSCLPRLTGWRQDELLKLGIKDVREIPENFPLTTRQELVRQTIVSGQEYLSSELKEYLRGLPYPRYYLDFETVRFAVPVWRGTRPYQQIPFQWSCHVEWGPGRVEHIDFLEISGRDPREDFVRSLVELLGDRGPIIVYGSFEGARLRELAEALPAFRERIESLMGRLVDLHGLLKGGYCHPEMRGSWSLKSVVPAVVPELSYEDLEVKEGASAEAVGAALILGEVSETERPRLIEALRRYCALDTEAMRRIVERLSE